MNKKGFTLVELLVVIAIIGLLSTIAVVSLSGARNKAVATKMVADLRTTQTALEAFATDNNGYPAAGATWSVMSLGTYMPTMPVAGSNTGYMYCNKGTYYLLLASTTVTGLVRPAGLNTTAFSGSQSSRCTGGVSLTAFNCGDANSQFYCLSNTTSVSAWND